MRLSHKERFVKAAAAEPTRAVLSRRQRRQGLIERSFVFEGAFGENPKLLEALEIAEKAAPTGLPVLIDGESGTGKELMAKVVHANGDRADRPFVSVNCGAIPDNLLESELFGHRRGAFTGASSDRKGKFESAHTGTIFLDEIGELPLTGQVKLLRVLEAHEIQRVGSDERIAVDARVVAATNRNLRQLCEEGKVPRGPVLSAQRHSSLAAAAARAQGRDSDAVRVHRRRSRRSAQAAPDRDDAATARVPAGLRVPGQYPRAAQHHLPALVPGGADGRPGASSRGHPARVSGAGRSRALRSMAMRKAVGAAAFSEAKRVASDQAEREFLERGLQEVGGVVTELAKRCDMNRSHLQTLLKKHGIRAKDSRHANSSPRDGAS